MSIVSGDASSGLTADLSERCWDVLQILSRARLAVHYYETLRPASSQLLADRGLNHGDLPRAAFKVLVGETQSYKLKRAFRSSAAGRRACCASLHRTCLSL